MTKGGVHGQEAPVAIDQRETDWEDVEQRLEVRRLPDRCRGARIEQKKGAGTPFGGRIDGQIDCTNRRRALAFRDQPHVLVALDLDEVSKPSVVRRLLREQGSFGEPAVGSDNQAFRIDNRRRNAGSREPLADYAFSPPSCDRERVGRGRGREAPEQ